MLISDAAQPMDREAADVVLLSLETTEIGGGFWRRLTGRFMATPSPRPGGRATRS